jgi:hypothetical protein
MEVFVPPSFCFSTVAPSMLFDPPHPNKHNKKSYETKNIIPKDDERQQQQHKPYRSKDAKTQPTIKPDEQE